MNQRSRQPVFSKIESAAAMTCSVRINICASTASVWSLLTDSEGFPSWSSTIVRIEGRIAEGERLRLHVAGTTRTFTPRVSGVVYERRMLWSDGIAPLFKGVRTFLLEPARDGSTDFVMEERFSGVIFALVKAKMPDFAEIFEAFALDLQRAAEREDEGLLRVGASR